MVSALIASGGIVFAFDVRRSFYPIYLRELGLAPAVIGALFSILALSGGLVRPFLGPACRLVRPTRLLTGVLIVGAVGWTGVTFSSSLIWLAAAAVLCGVTQGFGHPLTMSLVAGTAPPGMSGTGLGIRQVFNQVGQLLSPLALGLAVARVGRTAPAFVGAAATLLVAAAVVRLAPPSGEARW
jgi:sugar phosphate permease